MPSVCASIYLYTFVIVELLPILLAFRQASIDTQFPYNVFLSLPLPWNIDVAGGKFATGSALGRAS